MILLVFYYHPYQSLANDSVNAFVRKDDKLAAEVIATDDQVDRLFEEIKMELMEEIAKNPNSSGSELDVLMIAKYMERIGDHAVNLGEWVHYYVYGEKVEGKD